MLRGRQFFLFLAIVAVLWGCTKPAETEEDAATPESTGTVAGPSGSAVVTQVNSSTTDGAYKAGDVISVRVTFGLEATVTGTPRVLLETGNTDRYATYTSGSGSVTLVFSYTVMAGDESADLSYVNINSLELHGGTISGPSGAMNLVLPGLGGSGSLSVNRALVIDTTDPAATGAVTDGTYYNSLTASPTLSWAAATDTGGSGIAKYQVAIGTSSGGTQTLTWTDIGNVTTYQVTSGFSLTNGSTYYPSIRAVDLAGNISNVILGDGWIVDTTAPTSPATVYDGTSSYNTTASPTITWTTSTDVGGSGVAGYELAIGTTAGATDILNWTSVGTVISYARTGLTLSVGTTYYASIRAVDNAGNMTTAQGDGWQVVTCDTYGWCPQAYLKAPNAEAGDSFGLVAIDGDTIVVGASSEDSNQTTITNGTTASADNSAVHAGAAYVFKRTGNTWAQEAYLKAPNAESWESFARPAISGNTIVIGAYDEDSNQTTVTNGTTASADNTNTSSGAAYVFKRTGTTWAQEAYLKAPNSGFTDYFGWTVAISGDTIAVGAPMEDSNQTTITNGTTASANNSTSNSGAVYVFKRTGVNWAQEAYIKAPNADASDNFGIVSIYQDTLAVGATSEDSNQTTITNGTTASTDNSASTAGAVYVFKRTGTTWAQEAYIKAPNAEAGDQFYYVALHGDTLAVGAQGEDSNQTTITNGTTASADNSAGQAGAVYIFKRTGTTWAQEAYIKAPNAEASDEFGATALSGDILVVGAYMEDSDQTIVMNGGVSTNNLSSNSGAAYVFRRTGTTWAHDAYLKAPNANISDEFGLIVAIAGDTIVVGALSEDSNQTTITNGTTASADNSAESAGTAYVFTLNRQATWQQQAYVKAPNAETADGFGGRAIIEGNTLAVSATLEDSNQTTITNGTTASSDNTLGDSGAVYVFRRTGVLWAQEAYIKPPNPGNLDRFGTSIDISGDTLAVGMSLEDSNQTTITNGTTASSDNSSNNSGAVYVYKRTGSTWAQQAYIKAVNNGGVDQLGVDVSISGDTLAVGANQEDSNQTTITNGTTASSDNSSNNSGAVYVYKRTGTTWAQEAYIKAPNADANDMFGTRVSVDLDTIVVGSMYESSNQTTITNGSTASADNSAGSSGAVYVFKRTGSTWAQEAYIKASNAEATDYFGYRVAVSLDTIAVSAIAESSNQTTITNGSTASSNNSITYAGAVYVFKRLGTAWAQEAYIKPSNLNSDDYFGVGLSLDANSLVVGSCFEDSNQTTITNGSTASSDDSTADSGAAYVFKRIGATWEQEAYLKAPNAEASDEFGTVVSIDKDTIVVGSPDEGSNQTTITNGTTASSDNSAADSGAVYIFQR